MRNSFIKILAVMLIVGLNWAGLSAVLETFAYFNDTETSLGNTFTAGTLDFSLYSPNDFFPTSPGETNELTRDISVINKGSLNFKYQIRVGGISGDLCDNLQLVANLDGGNIECSAMDLENFSCGSFETLDSQDDWQFIVIPTKDHLLPQVCEFKLIFEAWQPELGFSSGFTDTEEINNTVYGSHFKIELDGVVLNEFLPNPVGSDDGLMTDGEWVELYNKGDSTVDVNGWKLFNGDISLGNNCNKSDNPINIDSSNTFKFVGGTWNASTSIGPGEFLVVFVNGTYLDWMNNDGDRVNLCKPLGQRGYFYRKDSYRYTGSVPEGKSFARIPDGSLNWYDPIPTPGGPNILESEITNQEEAIEEEPVVEEEIPVEKTPLAEEDSAIEEELIIDEESAMEEENPSVEEEPIAPEADNETGGETTEDVIEDTNSEREESPPSDEGPEGSTIDENLEEVSAAEAELTEEEVITEESLVDENSTVEEQPDTLPNDSSSTSGETREISSDEGSSDGGGNNGGSGNGGGDTSVNSDSDSPAEGGGEN